MILTQVSLFLASFYASSIGIAYQHQQLQHQQQQRSYENFYSKTRDPSINYLFSTLSNNDGNDFYRHNTRVQQYQHFYTQPSHLSSSSPSLSSPSSSSSPPSNQQFYSGLYYHPMMSSESTLNGPLSIQTSSDSLNKDPLTISSSSQSLSTMPLDSSDNSNQILQSQTHFSISLPTSSSSLSPSASLSSLTSSSSPLSPSSSSSLSSSSPSSSVSGIQSAKQSIIFGRSFTGFDGNFYIPVYYPSQWSYDQYPSASQIQSEFQTSNPAYAWSWSTSLPSNEITQSIRHPMVMPFRHNSASFIYPQQRSAIVSSIETPDETHLKRSENTIFNVRFPYNTVESSNNNVPETYVPTEMNYFLPYSNANGFTTKKRKHLPRALLGNIRTTNNLIVAPVFKLQDDYEDYSTQTSTTTISSSTAPTSSSSPLTTANIDGNEIKDYSKVLETNINTFDSNNQQYEPLVVNNKNNNNISKNTNSNIPVYGQRIHSTKNNNNSWLVNNNGNNNNAHDRTREQIESRSGNDLFNLKFFKSNSTNKHPVLSFVLPKMSSLPFVLHSKPLSRSVFRLPLSSI